MKKEKYNLLLAQEIVNEINRMEIDVTGSEPYWFEIACSLRELGEDGRELFHELSKFYSRYTEKEANAKFSRAMRENTLRADKPITFASFVKMAEEDWNIDLPSIRQRLRDRGYKPSYSPATTKGAAIRLPVPEEMVFDTLPLSVIDALQHRPSNFRSYLEEMLGVEAVAKVFTAYKVGALRDGRVVFPQIDAEGKCREAKVVRYYDCAHRGQEKHDITYLRYVMAAHGQTDNARGYRYKQCLFGLHLLPARPDAVIGLVESEKTALVCSVVMPDYIWVSTGGKGNFSPTTIAPLRGRKILIFPDMDGVSKWEEDIPKLLPNERVKVCRWWEGYDVKPKDDIADLILREIEKGKKGYQIPARVLELYPQHEGLQELCRVFELELLPDSPYEEIVMPEEYKPKPAWVERLRSGALVTNAM